MKVCKFGGSSLRDAERVEEVVSIIREELDEDTLVVVVSAMGKTTDALLAAYEESRPSELGQGIVAEHLMHAKQLGISLQPIEQLARELEESLAACQEGGKQEGDKGKGRQEEIVAYGERFSARMLACALHARGIQAQWADAWDLGFLQSPGDSSEMVLPDRYQEIRKQVAQRLETGIQVLVVTGFILKNEAGDTLTFGRGGSDLTASILGASLDAREVQVWKDVDGVLTADPRVVSNARPIEQLSYEEATELAYFGAKVLHPLCLQPVARLGIPVRVRNSYNRGSPGTSILPDTQKNSSTHSPRGVVAVTSKSHMLLIEIESLDMLGQYGFLARVFQVFADLGVSVDMIATSEVSVSLTMNPSSVLPELYERLQSFARVRIRKDMGAVSVIGKTVQVSAILATAGNCFVENKVPLEMVSVGSSKLNIGFVIPQDAIDESVRSLHEEFFFIEKSARLEH